MCSGGAALKRESSGNSWPGLVIRSAPSAARFLSLTTTLRFCYPQFVPLSLHTPYSLSFSFTFPCRPCAPPAKALQNLNARSSASKRLFSPTSRPSTAGPAPASVTKVQPSKHLRHTKRTPESVGCRRVQPTSSCPANHQKSLGPRPLTIQSLPPSPRSNPSPSRSRRRRRRSKSTRRPIWTTCLQF
ncbi:hypothetical protein GGX14DRAFT_172815 [Mycena pura]|uniref:Uncharacterized protein n=1 Tax=Mycena pura TaxID=153505 RepID=A0AAD6YAS0_9AGAR|nr:hypothetical protein GGX14DRAFT_172815 [Mycena pura]